MTDTLQKLMEHIGYGLATASTVTVIDEYLRERAKLALGILQEATRGKPLRLGEREIVGLYLTYQRSAEEGAAEPNLRLMAEAISNLAQESSFSTATARRHLTAIAGLSREEVIICAAFLRELRQPTDCQRSFTDHHIWERVRDALSGKPMFPTVNNLWGETSALCRTGWIAPVSGLDGGFWAASPQLSEVGRLVDFAKEAGRV